MSTDYSSQNFHHLEEIDPALAVLGTHAERYFVDDANTALIKTRQFAERLTQVLAEQSGTAFEQRESFADLLRKIRLDGAAPPEIIDLLHRIRISGNDAVHGFDPSKAGDLARGVSGPPDREVAVHSPGYRSCGSTSEAHT